MKLEMVWLIQSSPDPTMDTGLKRLSHSELADSLQDKRCHVPTSDPSLAEGGGNVVQKYEGEGEGKGRGRERRRGREREDGHILYCRWSETHRCASLV